MAKRYDKEFKLHAVKQVTEQGKTAAQVCRELDLAQQTLSKRIHIQSRGIYGNPKITQVLLSEGVKVSQKTVSTIMKEEKLKSRTVKKYKATTNSKHTLLISPNLLNQKFTVDAPGKAWVTDITYVWTIHSLIKKEWIFYEKYRTRAQAKVSILDYILHFYNCNRIHGTIGYKTPIAYEKEYYKQKKAS